MTAGEKDLCSNGFCSARRRRPQYGDMVLMVLGVVSDKRSRSQRPTDVRCKKWSGELQEAALGSIEAIRRQFGGGKSYLCVRSADATCAKAKATA